MIGNQIGVSQRVDSTKVNLLAELIWEAQCEAYSNVGQRRYVKPWTELSIHDQNRLKEKAEHFLKFYSKFF